MTKAQLGGELGRNSGEQGIMHRATRGQSEISRLGLRMSLVAGSLTLPPPDRVFAFSLPGQHAWVPVPPSRALYVFHRAREDLAPVIDPRWDIGGRTPFGTMNPFQLGSVAEEKDHYPNRPQWLLDGLSLPARPRLDTRASRSFQGGRSNEPRPSCGLHS